MELQYAELDNGIRLITLIGILDMQGTFSVEVQFARHCSGDGVRVLVDLSKVTYLSSIGIPMLINTARSVASQGGKMGLLGPIYDVHRVLDITGATQIIPIYHDFDTAVADILKETLA